MSVEDSERLIRVEASDFVAGLILRGDLCIAAAPVIGWAVGRDLSWLSAAFANKRWRVRVVA